jgi:hypothetical protein
MRVSVTGLALATAGCIIHTRLADGFAFLPPHLSFKTKSPVALFMESDAPSDTSTDDDSILTVAYEDLTDRSESVVNSVLNQLPTAMGEVTTETRTAINEALYKLEALNPTSNPTMSPLLNGVWELRYAAGYSAEWSLPSPTRQLALFLYSGGYSPGLFALSLAKQLPVGLVDVGPVEISISREQPRVEASVKVKLISGSLENDVTVRARLEVQSQVRMKETYETVSILDQEMELPSFIQYSRDLYVTYVDEDLLVVRDASGVPEILVRKSKTFQQNWGQEPESLTDMVAPGEEQDIFI